MTVRPSRIAAEAASKRFAEQNLAAGRIHSARRGQNRPGGFPSAAPMGGGRERRDGCNAEVTVRPSRKVS